jgi:transglutaminase-like putative cysteine protease
VSAGVATAGRVNEEPGRGFSLSPVEGWLTVFAAALMVAVFAVSLIDADWAGPRAGSPGFLLYVGLLGFGIGVLGAKVGWGRWRTHFVGALLGGLLLPLVMGGLVMGGDVGWSPADMAQRMAAAFEVMQRVWSDLFVRALQRTNEIAHYHLVFGVLVYGAGLLAGFTVFGHRRPLDAVVVVGLATLANMAITEHPQLYLLVVFSAAALFLLIRTHVFEEEITWARRKIGDPAAVGQLYIRGGAAFVTVAIVGSILLTFTASSAPLQGLWADLPRQLQDLAQVIQKIAPPGGDSRGPGIVGFAQNATTLGQWQPSSLTAFQALVDRTEKDHFKWRAGTYAVYKDTLNGWAWDSEDLRVRREPVGANDAYQTSTFLDAATPTGRREVRITITPDSFRDPTVIAPNSIRAVDRPTEAVVIGDDGWFTSIQAPGSNGSYTLTALVPVYGNGPNAINEARLRTAGTDYPAELAGIYTKLPDRAMGPRATELLQDILQSVRVPQGFDPDNPYDLARTIEGYLHSDRFQYEEDVRQAVIDSCPADISSVECFAIIRQGYCEYYASTMAVLLRSEGVPARIAYGFLPSERSPEGIEIIGGANMHWWVEVYFPGIGWIEFDPTGGQVGQPQAIPSGSLGPATPRPTGAVNFTAPPERTPLVDGGGPPPTAPGGGIGPFIAIGLILLVGVVALAFAAVRRVPTKPMHPDQAWGSVARLAARVGLGPRPSQTVYEYAGALGDAVPTARVELTTIARAKVEVAYGRHELGGDRLKRIAEAYHRLRLAIVGVVLRRFLRRPRRGGRAR